jgi:Fic-DOC domain mobile mystery protein B
MESFDAPYGATPLDPSELEGLKFKNIATRGQLDELESHSVSAGRLWLARRKNKPVLTDDFLKTFHIKLFGSVWSWAGKYRNTEKNIGIDPLHIPVEIRKLLDDVKYWIENGTYNRIELAARLHHRLVRIHPFPNGNGRIARLYTNAVLINEMKEKPLVWSAGKLHMIPDNEERRSYIEALRAADAGDMQPLIDYLTVRNPA